MVTLSSVVTLMIINLVLIFGLFAIVFDRLTSQNKVFNEYERRLKVIRDDYYTQDETLVRHSLAIQGLEEKAHTHAPISITQLLKGNE